MAMAMIEQGLNSTRIAKSSDQGAAQLSRIIRGIRDLAALGL